MTGNAINTKSEALELSSEELDAVSGGMDLNGAASAEAAIKNQNALENAQKQEENRN